MCLLRSAPLNQNLQAGGILEAPGAPWPLTLRGFEIASVPLGSTFAPQSTRFHPVPLGSTRFHPVLELVPSDPTRLRPPRPDDLPLLTLFITGRVLGLGFTSIQMINWERPRLARDRHVGQFERLVCQILHKSLLAVNFLCTRVSAASYCSCLCVLQQLLVRTACLLLPACCL